MLTIDYVWGEKGWSWFLINSLGRQLLVIRNAYINGWWERGRSRSLCIRSDGEV